MSVCYAVASTAICLDLRTRMRILSSWQIVNFYDYFLGIFYFQMCDVSLEKRRFRSRIKVFGFRSATLPWTAVLRIVINGTVSLIRKRKNILGWVLIIGALCFLFTNFVCISRLKGKIAVWSPYLSNKIKKAGVRIKMEYDPNLLTKFRYATSDSLRH
jgi:hypothetical protein